MYVFCRVPGRFFFFFLTEVQPSSRSKIHGLWKGNLLSNSFGVYTKGSDNIGAIEVEVSYPKGWGKQNSQFVERIDGTLQRSVLTERCGEVKGEKGDV